MKAWILAIIFGVIAIAPIGLTLYLVDDVVEQNNFWFQFEDQTDLEVGLEFEIRACRILEDNRFQLYLKGGNGIEARLSHELKPEANQVILNLLNTTTPPAPSVILRKNFQSYWVVDFYLTVDGKRTNLLGLLKSKNLLN